MEKLKTLGLGLLLGATFLTGGLASVYATMRPEMRDVNKDGKVDLVLHYGFRIPDKIFYQTENNKFKTVREITSDSVAEIDRHYSPK